MEAPNGRTKTEYMALQIAMILDKAWPTAVATPVDAPLVTLMDNVITLKWPSGYTLKLTATE
jgi:hypothetical protein